MAFFGKGNTALTLLDSDNEVAFVVPDVTPLEDDVDVVTVSWYAVNSGMIAEIPSRFICSGKSYAIRVVAEGDISDFVFMGIPVLKDGITVYPLVEGLTAVGKALFVPEVGSNITGNSSFTATLAGIKSSFTFFPNDNWEEAGLAEKLPAVLSNCSTCGCLTGQLCQDGICSGTPDLPCAENGICGQQNGKCFGKCSSENSDCVLIDGAFTCVEAEFNGVNWWAYVAIVVVSILLIFLFYGLYKVTRNYFNASGDESYIENYDAPVTETRSTRISTVIPNQRETSVALGDSVYSKYF